MKYYIGGYYLMEGARMPDSNKALLPDKIWSVSVCINDIHPEEIALSWVESTKEEKLKYQEKLRLDDNQFLHLQKEVDALNKDEALGWGMLFLNSESAKDFYNKYLCHIPDIKLLAIVTTENCRNIFLQEQKPGNNQGKTGVYQCLELGLSTQIENGFRGFEVLGYELSGHFHSFICYSLENVLSNKLKISFNKNGLIPTLSEAEKASEYISSSESGAAPVLWMPWAIMELPL